MRIVELAVDEAERVALHPRITVVAGGAGERRTRIVTAVTGIAAGDPGDGVSGVAEAHGIRFSLQAATLALLDVVGDPGPVLRPADLAGAAVPELDPEAAGLADHLAAVRAEIERWRTDVEQRARRVEEARAALLAAQREATSTVVDPADAAELEAAHAAVEEAESGPSLFGRRRVAAAREAEQAVLERMGLPSYAAYVIRTSTMNVDGDTQRRLVEAAAELRAAEDDFGAAAGGGGDPPAELRERRDVLQDRAAAAARAATEARAATLDEIVTARLAGPPSPPWLGPLPVAVDHALDGLADADADVVVGALARRSETAQVVVVTDDPRAAAWVQRWGSAASLVD